MPKKIDIGFLDKLGDNDRGDGMALSASAAALVDAAAFLISEAQNNLDKKGSVASGELSESLHAEDIDAEGKVMFVDIVLLDRYKFIDQGVKGVESGSGKYAFKTKYPNKKMATSILKWIRKRGIGGQRALKYRSFGAQEKKDIVQTKRVSESDNLKALAYATATNIKKHGIKKTLFFTKAVKATQNKFKELIKQGLRVDIIESLNNGNRT